MNGAIICGGEVLILGPDVRPEYLKLPGDLVALSRSFGIELPDQYLRDAVVLTFAIECVDRLLDSIPTGVERASFCAEVMDYLEGRPGDARQLTQELLGWLLRLREVTGRRRIAESVCQIVRELLSNSEQMRTARHTKDFANCAALEGRLMVELLLLIIGAITAARFNDFMRRLSEPANLVDKLRDAQRDHVCGELAIKPGFGFRLRLSLRMLRSVLSLARFCFGNPRLLAWGFRSFCSEVRFA